jgi:Kef-type K+ transport system membrane component KefB
MRLPAIAGLLISGAIIGPNGFNLLSPDLEFSLLGTMGLLYLMFLAGLEIDLLDFIENKLKSIFIGLATFIIPFIIGYLICRHLLNYDFIASWLIAAMLSSHTLISYPLLGRLGIVNKPIVTIVVGATIIADVLALISMELITNIADQGVQLKSFLIIGLQFLLFFFVVLLIIPRLSKVFLRRYEGDLGVQYIFVLFILFSSSLVAYLLEIEPILGAFFSGLVLNRLVFNSSPLYKRIEFIGNNLFIPFFLISIGILTNLKVYFEQPSQLIYLFVLLLAAFAGKYFAALISRVFLNTSKTETNILFGLSVSRAASAIAIILIGFNMGIISEEILNNTVMLILVTSLSSSYITQRAGKKLLLEGESSTSKKKRIKQKILVPLANPDSMKNLLEFASLIKDEKEANPIYPLTIYTNKAKVRKNIHSNQNRITKLIEELPSEVLFEISTRIDDNVTNGIVRTADELMATTIIMGWNKNKTTFEILFGSVLNNLLNKTERTVIVVKTPSSFREIRKIQLFCPQNAQFEKGFYIWVDSLILLIRKLQVKVGVHCSSRQTLEFLKQYLQNNSVSKYFVLNKEETNDQMEKAIQDSTSDLLIFVHSRKKAVSYNKLFDHTMKSTINKPFTNNMVIIYPEQ